LGHFDSKPVNNCQQVVRYVEVTIRFKACHTELVKKNERSLDKLGMTADFNEKIC